MPKTREQKKKDVEEIKERLQKSKGFLLFGFSGVSVNKLNDFRSEIRDANGTIRVVKHRLFNLSLKEKNIDFRPRSFVGQIAFVAFDEDILDIIGIVYDFVKDEEVEGEILGGYNIEAKEIYESEYLEKLGRLPSREILLGQVVSGIAGPIRSFVYTLKAIADKG